MKYSSLFCIVFIALIAIFASTSSATTIAHWDMADAGASDGAYMPGNGERADLDGDGAMGTDDFRISSVDLSGNGNHLTAWSSSWMKWTADSYKGDFGMQATNGYPACGTDSTYNPDIQAPGYAGINAETITPSQWTVECIFKATADTNRTIVGRDGYGVRTSDARTAPFYLAERGGASINCEFVDVTGAYYNAISAGGTLVAGTWYQAAAVSNGTTLTLYLKNLTAGTDYQIVATANLSASTNSSLARGYGTWSVSRGMWNNNHTDRFMGVVDEVAISDTALTPAQFVTRDSVTLTESNGRTFLYSGDTHFTDSYDVVLVRQPSSNVAITITPPAGLSVGNGNGQSKVLTFTNQNWNQAQTVTVQIADAGATLSSPQIISHTSASQDSSFNTLYIRNVSVDILAAECGSLGYLDGDYNLDCFVNLLDFSLLAQVWLETDVPLELNPLAGDWLKNSMTGDPGAIEGPVKKSTQPYSINTTQIASIIDEKIYGHFLEHIYHSVNGGLWGELVWNRSFENYGSNGQGIWTIDGTELVQSSLATDVRLPFGDTTWQDYEYTLQAEKTGGNEGFLIMFRANGGDFYWLNLGGWGNTKHVIEKSTGGSRGTVGTQVTGSITTGQWYNIRIRCEGGHFQVFLDSTLIIDYTDSSPHLSGQVGVGTWATQARFRNIQVTRISDSAVLYSGLPAVPTSQYVSDYWNPFGTGTIAQAGSALNGDYCISMTAATGQQVGVQQTPFKLTTQKYTGSLWAKGSVPGGLRVQLLDGETVLGQATLSAPTSTWQEYPFQITPSAPASPGTLRISLIGTGTVYLDQVSLMGQDAIDTGGFRPDLLQAVKGLKPTIIRWPGGYFAELYRWKSGIGPQSARVKYPIVAWNDQDTNAFGTDEYIKMCRSVGCEPLIVINIGQHDSADKQADYVTEAQQWVEYCNGSATSTWGAVRAANGHPEPYNVKYWEIGNECWFQMDATTYAAKFQVFAPALRAIDPSIKIIACGSGGYDQTWNQTLITACAASIDYVSIHQYESPDSYASAPVNFEGFINTLGSIIAASANPNMKIFMSEWNAQSTDWRTGLFAGGMLNGFERQSNHFAIGSPALFLRHTSATDWDNAFINFDYSGWFAAPNYVVMKLWHDHYAPNLASTTGGYTDLNVDSTLSGDGNTLNFKVVNPTSTERSMALTIDDSFVPKTAYLHYVAPGDLYARNTLTNPDTVHVQAKAVGVNSQTIRFQLPAYSAGVVTVHK